jgi:hypothetical protein
LGTCLHDFSLMGAPTANLCFGPHILYEDNHSSQGLSIFFVATVTFSDET